MACKEVRDAIQDLSKEQHLFWNQSSRPIEFVLPKSFLLSFEKGWSLLHLAFQS